MKSRWFKSFILTAYDNSKAFHLFLAEPLRLPKRAYTELYDKSLRCRLEIEVNK